MKLRLRGCVVLMAVGAGTVLWGQTGSLSSKGSPVVCENADLRQAIRIIERACTDLSCDFGKLRELDSRVDKPTLLAALRDPYLAPVHLFFPANESSVYGAFDWSTIKKSQVDSLAHLNDPENAVVFVLGRASQTGDYEHNKRLSRERMQSVLKYLKEDLRIRCSRFRGAWFGKEILQLARSDARHLNLEPDDYRQDELILNQAVHVFVFPCGDLLD